MLQKIRIDHYTSEEKNLIILYKKDIHGRYIILNRAAITYNYLQFLQYFISGFSVENFFGVLFGYLYFLSFQLLNEPGLGTLIDLAWL